MSADFEAEFEFLNFCSCFENFRKHEHVYNIYAGGDGVGIGGNDKVL